ncbi:unnamed protein product, partial [marine sediment metagenome]
KEHTKNGYMYVRGRVICGICCADMGTSNNAEGELSYDGCEEE